MGRLRHIIRRYWVLTIAVVECFWYVPINAEDSVALLDGAYMTTTDVSSWLQLTLDIKGMSDPHVTQDRKKAIYRQGISSVDGTSKVSSQTLAGLSMNAHETMLQDPIFGFFVAFFLEFGRGSVEDGVSGTFENKPVTQYADELVMDLFQLQSMGKLESDAALVHNVWMCVVHQLYVVQRACEKKHEDMNVHIDIAAALWIGDEQDFLDGTSGHMMYSWAERIWANQIPGQANRRKSTNDEFVEGLNNLQTMAVNGSCNDDPDGYTKVRALVRKMIWCMTVPLVEGLIMHILRPQSLERDKYVTMYALALAPRVAVCDPSAHGEFMRLITDADLESYSAPAIKLVQSVYSCLDVSCEQVGTYEANGVTSICHEDTSLPRFAGYEASSEQAMSFTRFDRDILQIETLLSLGFDRAALDYYRYGSNVYQDDRLYSLQELARSESRSVVVDQYNLFRAYFRNRDYADYRVVDILTKKFLHTRVDRPSLVIDLSGTLRVMIMYMAILEKAYQALDACDKETQTSAASLVDQTAAFYVGSMEGSDDTGRKGGRLLFRMSKGLCTDFSSCDDSGNSRINQEFLSALTRMKQNVLIGKCNEASNEVASKVAPLLALTLLQGSLQSSIKKLESSTPSDSKTTVEAEVLIESVLPLLKNTNKEEAEAISYRVDLGRGQGSHDENIVVSAFGDIISQMKIPDVQQNCEYIGVYRNVKFNDLCLEVLLEKEPLMDAEFTSRPKVGMGLLALLVTLVAGGVTIGAVFYYRRRGRQRVHEFQHNFEPVLNFELMEVPEGKELS